jgi:hypothetical protein
VAKKEGWAYFERVDWGIAEQISPRVEGRRGDYLPQAPAVVGFPQVLCARGLDHRESGHRLNKKEGENTRVLASEN